MSVETPNPTRRLGATTRELIRLGCVSALVFLTLLLVGHASGIVTAP